MDEETKQPVPFANILINGGPYGGMTDIDGIFRLNTTVDVKTLRVSCLSYQTLTLQVVTTSKEIIIELKRSPFQLSEVVVRPGINPAHLILRKVQQNSYANNYENLPGFSYIAYEKTLVGPVGDTIPVVDSLASSTNYKKIKDFFDKQYLFIMENVSERKFEWPDKDTRRILASHVSGLSDPVYAMLIADMQSSSFYSEMIKIYDKSYVNPIYDHNFSRYSFRLTDTIIEPGSADTTFVITFRPLKGVRFDAMTGSLSVSSNGYAIKNVNAGPVNQGGFLSLKIQQLYAFTEGHWFPSQLNTDFVMKPTVLAIEKKKRKKVKMKMAMAGHSKSYITGIQPALPPNSQVQGFLQVEVAPLAYRQPEPVWEQYRNKPLNPREKYTYHIIDSIGESKHLNRISRIMETAITGKIPMGYVDVQVSSLLKHNFYEGYRPGLKLLTSTKLSRRFVLGGYFGYGIKDKVYKYGAESQIILGRLHTIKLGFNWQNDYKEAGPRAVFADIPKPLLNPASFRNGLVDRLSHEKSIGADVEWRLFHFLRVKTGLQFTNAHSLFTYAYVLQKADNIELTATDFNFSEASISFRYAYREKFLKNPNNLVALTPGNPIAWFTYTRGFTNDDKGDFAYNRFDFRFSGKRFYKYVGTSSFVLLAGWIDRDLPFVRLFNGFASYKNWGWYPPESFVTMHTDEFTVDRFANVFLAHDFGGLRPRWHKFNPNPSLVFNLGLGSISHPENHKNIELKGYDKGYIETGIVVDNILKVSVLGVGIGCFYRIGPYALPSWKQNIAAKISIVL